MRTQNAQPVLSARATTLRHRLLELAAAVVKLLPPLSEQPGAKSLVKQLERCGPAGGANCEEARGAESSADFIHKVRIAAATHSDQTQCVKRDSVLFSST